MGGRISDYIARRLPHRAADSSLLLWHKGRLAMLRLTAFATVLLTAACTAATERPDHPNPKPTAFQTRPCADQESADKRIEVGVVDGRVAVSDASCKVRDSSTVTWFNSSGAQFRIMFKDNTSPQKPINGGKRDWDFPSIAEGGEQKAGIRAKRGGNPKDSYSYVVIIGDHALDPSIIIDPN
jgi:hypothetical protein